MKKFLTAIALVALLLVTGNPLTNAEASTKVENGVYTTTKYYTIAEFKKLSTANKSTVLTTPGTVVVLGTLVYKATDVLTASDVDLPKLAVKVSDYTTDAGNKLASSEKLDSNKTNPTTAFTIISIE